MAQDQVEKFPLPAIINLFRNHILCVQIFTEAQNQHMAEHYSNYPQTQQI